MMTISLVAKLRNPTILFWTQMRVKNIKTEAAANSITKAK